MKAFVKYVVLAMILLAVAMMSGLMAMRLAIHGREVAVPKFIGMSPADADKLAANNGLLILHENKFYSAEIPAGRIVSQSPAPDARVRRGWRVRVAESLGPQRVQVPDIVGQSQRAAEINIRRRGLELSSIATAPLHDVPPDQIIAQSPPANAQGVASPKISLLTAATSDPAAFVMPDFSGMKLGEASVAIADAGLKLAPIAYAKAPTPSQVTNPAAEAIIVRQTPPPGQKVSAGMFVTLEVQH
jgi:eukaryotic-like serine/threonine-protein kinase